jgi:hypothetical protein
MNHREKMVVVLRKRAERIKTQVCAELRWTEEEYNDFWMDAGRKYLETYLNGDAYSIETLAKSGIFWKWWKNHWMARDESFLEFVVNTAFGISDKRDNYLELHNATTLARCIYPTGVVLNETYANMITDLVHEEVAKEAKEENA